MSVSALDPDEVAQWVEDLQAIGCIAEEETSSREREPFFEMDRDAQIVVEEHGVYLPVSRRIRIWTTWGNGRHIVRGISLLDGVHPYPYANSEGALRLTGEMTKEILDGSQKLAKEQLVMDPLTSLETLVALAGQGYLLDVIQRETITPEEIDPIIRSLDVRQRLRLAEGGQTLPEFALATLADDVVFEVRKGLACLRESTLSVAVMDRLSKDSGFEECVEYRLENDGRPRERQLIGVP